LMKKWARSIISKEGKNLSVSTLAVLLTAVFSSALITSKIGIFAIFGGFILGAILFDERELRQAVQARLQDFVRAFFVPIFFMYTGLRTDIGSMQGSSMWTILVLAIAVAIFAKVAPATLAARVTGCSWPDSLAMGALMNTRALMELVVLNIGFDLGVIPKSVFFMFVVMAVITTFMTAPLLRRTQALVPLRPPDQRLADAGLIAASGD